MSGESFESVWDAIEDTEAESASMKLKSKLMMALSRHIEAQGWTQTEAARALGVTQPRISDLLRGRIALFGLESLIAMAGAANLSVELSISEGARAA
ncbi:transcriptional regulator [Alphaproteobacteria bacterium]|nr:transcriptional regulator [Alphaproteobacteria bacterium]